MRSTNYRMDPHPSFWENCEPRLADLDKASEALGQLHLLELLPGKTSYRIL